eukprot:3425587-Lingulodinium_polyedra.AAC.1
MSRSPLRRPRPTSPIAMRANYLAQGRADLQRAVREIAKGTQAPIKRHWYLLKRAARYLLRAPRCAI